MGHGNVLHGGVVMGCPHGGLVVPVPGGGGGTDTVRIDGAAVVTAADPFTVSGCAHTVAGRPRPCVDVRFVPDGGGAGQVCVDGVPVLLETAAGMCFGAGPVPQGPPVIVSAGRGRPGGVEGVACR
ncbi:hypothetical protein [Streptomyces catenulae]|uniref:PAAR motif protein n=1 Tax=Streptomyces catenulae TaxID=66875 RepID=A0ABV2YSR8_9ACTN|nr:hypothetical protein [Streptomyces catenulae]